MHNERGKRGRRTETLSKSFLSLSVGVMTHAAALKRRFVYCVRVCIQMPEYTPEKKNKNGAKVQRRLG